MSQVESTTVYRPMWVLQQIHNEISEHDQNDSNSWDEEDDCLS